MSFSYVTLLLFQFISFIFVSVVTIRKNSSFWDKNFIFTVYLKVILLFLFSCELLLRRYLYFQCVQHRLWTWGKDTGWSQFSFIVPLFIPLFPGEVSLDRSLFDVLIITIIIIRINNNLDPLLFVWRVSWVFRSSCFIYFQFHSSILFFFFWSIFLSSYYPICWSRFPTRKIKFWVICPFRGFLD